MYLTELCRSINRTLGTCCLCSAEHGLLQVPFACTTSTRQNHALCTVHESGTDYHWFFIHSDHFYSTSIAIALLQIHYYSEALPTQHGYCAGVSRRSVMGNCKLRTCTRSLRGG